MAVVRLLRGRHKDLWREPKGVTVLCEAVTAAASAGASSVEGETVEGDDSEGDPEDIDTLQSIRRREILPWLEEEVRGHCGAWGLEISTARRAHGDGPAVCPAVSVALYVCPDGPSAPVYAAPVWSPCGHRVVTVGASFTQVLSLEGEGAMSTAAIPAATRAAMMHVVKLVQDHDDGANLSAVLSSKCAHLVQQLVSAKP
jgi:hypothetical protein